MINNRQNGRRRGRGGAPRQNGGNGQSGNRIDNRARGNAAQLHEKYKTLARDAQTQGDRVMTEYYLQFADHYFRVLSENRPRFEEQQRRERFGDQDFEDEGDGETEAQGSDREERQRDGRDRDYRGQRDRDGGREERRPREYRNPREPREQDAVVEARPVETVATEAPQPVEVAPEAEPVEAAPRRRGRPRRIVQPEADTESQERIEVDRLPPSLALNGGEEAEPAAEEKPKRRTRRPRSEAASAEA